MIYSNFNAIPVDATQSNLAVQSAQGSPDEARVASYIITWRNQLRSAFIQRRNIWDDCWKLYRGLADFTSKEDWQSKIVLPKSFASVKMATNTIKRLLATSKKPFNLEAVNQEDLITVLRAEQMTNLVRLFLDKTNFLAEFTEGLETGFIIGLGVWKLWWGLVPRTRFRVQNQMVPVPQGMEAPQLAQGGGPPGASAQGELPPGPAPDYTGGPASHNQSLLVTEAPGGEAGFAEPTRGFRLQDVGQYPNQLGGEFLNPLGWGQGLGLGLGQQPPLMMPQKQLIKEEVLEGQLFLKAVDPYNFLWVPGSKLNRWAGTIEEVEIPRYELIRMAEAGLFSPDKVAQVMPRRIDERYMMRNLRWNETLVTQNGPNNDTAVCKLTEYFGPIVLDGKIIEEYAHVILGNDSIVLLYQKNPFWHRQPPYVAFSPLALPFRTEGIGLIEMVREIDKALSHIANLGVDTLMFRLLPLFEVDVDAFENPEDLETGITPGKMLRKSTGRGGQKGIQTVQFEDISPGTVQIAGMLDRSHQEGSLISDIAEGIPRWRGQQTATESQLLQTQGDSFMGSMAADIERQALDPIVSMAKDLILQFIDTSNDPRVASVLGVNADMLASMSREEIMELVQGDYKVKATGITDQLQKAEMLQNLVQFMNLIGQNPQAWLPYVNQDALLRRILEAFRPQIHDIEDVIADPEIAEAKAVQMRQADAAPDMMAMLPQLLQMQHNAGQAQQDTQTEFIRMQHEKEMQSQAQAHQQAMQQAQMQGQMQLAQTKQPAVQQPQIG